MPVPPHLLPVFLLVSLVTVFAVALWVFLHRPLLGQVALSADVAAGALAHRLRLEGYWVAEEGGRIVARVDKWARLVLHLKCDDRTEIRYAVGATPAGWTWVLVFAIVGWTAPIAIILAL